MTDTKQHITLITGGSRGLGKSMALQIAAKGNDVIITYHSKKEEADQVVKEITGMGRKAIALQLDVANSKGFPAFIAQLKEALQTQWSGASISYLVNNAGVGTSGTLADTTEEQFDQMVNIHLKAPFFLTQQLLPLLTDGGGIVNISSGLARFTYSGYDAYATMKGGVETLTRYQAKFLGSRKIRVNTVAPGAIETDFGGGAVRDNQEMNQFIASQTALGRAGLPDDVGKVVAFLCSDESAWINAQRIEVAGGIHI